MRIDILVDKAARSITIRDNGAEIEKSKAQATLLNIGSSSKRHSKNRGFRGIGRLGGMSYCNTLMFYPFKLGISQPRPIFPFN